MLSADFSRLKEEIEEITSYGVEYLHIDVMDGQFVENISFGPAVFASVRDCTQLIFDVHMMVDQPERYIPMIAEAGADIITVHCEATVHLDRAIQMIHSYGKKAGVTLNPGTPIEQLSAVLDKVDLVLVMTVNPGFGGQAFIPSMVEKIKWLNQQRQLKGYHYEIEVDGGINETTAKECVKAGADVLVAGSYIFNAPNRQEAIQSLRLAECRGTA